MKMTHTNAIQMTSGLSRNLKLGLVAAVFASTLMVGSLASADQFHGSSVYGKLRDRYTDQKLTDEEIYNRAQGLDLSYGDFGKAPSEQVSEEASNDFHGSSVYGKLRDRYTDEKLSDEEIYNRAQGLDLSYGDFGQAPSDQVSEASSSDFHGSSVYGKLRDRYTDEKLSDEEIYNRAQGLDLSYGDFH